jgi:tetratricopeptide (TPR) repeat protein
VRALAIGLIVGLCATSAAGPRGKPKPKPEPPPEPPKTEEKSRADKLFDDGRKYLATKEYALACTAFEQSQEADPAIGTQLNIALCYETWGHFASAYRAYLEAEKLAKAKSDERAIHAHKKLDELQPKIPHLRIDVLEGAEPSAVFLLDGKEIDRKQFVDELLLDAGPHTIEATVPGKPPKTTKVELQNGEHKELVVDVPKIELGTTVVPRKSGRLYGGIAMISGGVIVVGVSSYVALLARSDYNSALLGCPMGLCETHAAYQQTQDARSRANLMTVVGGAGVALVGIGVYLVLTSKGEAPKKEHVTALVAPGVVGVAYGSAW